MKRKLLLPVAAVLGLAVTTSCTTTYDAYGRPVQSVDPGLALLGVAAAGVAGYAIAEANNDGHRHYKHHSRSYGHRYHGQGYNHGYGYGGHRSHYRPPRCHY